MPNHILRDPIEIPVLQNVVRAGDQRLKIHRITADLHSPPDLEVGQLFEAPSVTRSYKTPPPVDFDVELHGHSDTFAPVETIPVETIPLDPEPCQQQDPEENPFSNYRPAATLNPKLEAMIDELIDHHIMALREDISALLAQALAEAAFPPDDETTS